MDNPIIRRMPSVVGTGGVECIGASTIYGFLYCVKNDGIYSWQGGDGSQLISPQLEDEFWDVSSGVTNFVGGILSWGSWVLCPNNYIFDGKAWWRLEDPSVAQYMQYDRDPVNNIIYAARGSFSDTSTIYASGYSTSTPASSYSWQSQPLGLTNTRRAHIRSVELVAQGAGTVDITITPTDGDTATSQPSQVTVSTSGPKRFKLPCDIFGTEFVVRIVSAHTDTGAAPVVYQLDLEVEERGGIQAQ